MFFKVSILVGWVHKILHQLRWQISYDYTLKSVCLRNAPKNSVFFFSRYREIFITVGHHQEVTPISVFRSGDFFSYWSAKLDLQEAAMISVCCG